MRPRLASKYSLALLLSLVFTFAAVPSTASTAETHKFVFERVCPDGVPKPDSDDYYKLCDEFFRTALTGNPDAVFYLRERIYALVSRTENNQSAAFWKYELSTWLSFSFAIVAATLTLLKASFIADLKNVVIAAAFLVIAVSTSFGWHQQYRAEFAASQALKSLRDEINIAAVQAASSKAPITAEQLERFVRDYRTIMEAHAKSYAEAFSAPSLGTSVKELLGLK